MLRFLFGPTLVVFVAVYLTDLEVAILAYPLLEPVNRTLSLASSALRVTFVTIASMSLVAFFLMLPLVTSTTPRNRPGHGDRPTLREVMAFESVGGKNLISAHKGTDRSIQVGYRSKNSFSMTAAVQSFAMVIRLIICIRFQ